MKVEDCGGGLGGRFIYYFPAPQNTSKYGRHEVDALLKGDDDQPVNSMQKGVEETWLLVRLLTPEKGPVVSMCNGTGTALVATLLEGRVCLRVEKDRVQNHFARLRL